MPWYLCFFIFYWWDRNGQVIKQGSLLHVAAYCGAVECLKYLIEHKAEVDKRDEVSLFFIFFALRYILRVSVVTPPACKN